MSIFTDVKAQVHLPNVAEYYGVQVNRGGFASCLFHEDRTPSMKLYDDHFHCYGCGKHGDVITLTGQIFNILSYQAAQKLAHDFSISVDTSNVKYTQPLRKNVPISYIQQANRAYAILNRYCIFLEDCREIYKPNSHSDELHPLFVESLSKYDLYCYYRDIFLFGMKDERTELINNLQKELDYIEQRFQFTSTANVV